MTFVTLLKNVRAADVDLAVAVTAPSNADSAKIGKLCDFYPLRHVGRDPRQVTEFPDVLAARPRPHRCPSSASTRFSNASILRV